VRLAGAVASSLTGDSTLTNNDLKALARTFRGLNPASVEMTTLPVTVQGSDLVTEYPEATPVLARLRDLSLPLRLPEAIPPSKVKVVVVDGSGVAGRAASVAAKLHARGFDTTGSGDASTSDFARTQIRYASGEEAKGFTVALYLGTTNLVETPDTSVKLGSQTLNGDVLVVLGRDYPTLRGALSRPVPTSTTSTTAPASTTTSPASTTTTSTTPVTTPDTRFVPVAKKGLGPLVGCP